MLKVVAVQRLGAEAELEAVVLGRIVRAGDLDAADDVQVVQAPVEHGRRHDADVDDVDAGARQAVDERVAQLVAARPVVAADGDVAGDAALAA